MGSVASRPSFLVRAPFLVTEMGHENALLGLEEEKTLAYSIKRKTMEEVKNKRFDTT